MKTNDYLTVALAPFSVLWIPFVGNLTVDDWDWSVSDFIIAYGILAGAMLVYKVVATRDAANLAYRLGAGLAVLAGFLVTWVTLAVQIIGDENPGNTLYLGAILLGLVGVAVSGFRAHALARLAFALAGTIFAIPLVSVVFWPTDFAPGFGRVCVLNFGFVGLFAIAGLLFRHAASQRAGRLESR